MGMGKDSVIVIHMGVRSIFSLRRQWSHRIDEQGVYGDKPATLERFKENYTTKLSDEIKARLVLENDEVCGAFVLPGTCVDVDSLDML